MTESKEEQKVLDARSRVDDINKLYGEMMGDTPSFSCLLQGIRGTGKTRMVGTGRLPILVDVFDPKGTVIFHTDPVLNKLRLEGKIILRPWWGASYQNPAIYERWVKTWQEDCKSGFLSLFGTYAMDSGTTWIEAQADYIRYKKGRGDNLQVQDYNPMYNFIMDFVKVTSSQGCDLIYIAHLVPERNELTGGVVAELDTYSRLRSKLPKLFSEKYVMVKEKSPGDPKHVLLTHSTGVYEASSQLKAGNPEIKAKEEPDIKKLLKKAGLPSEDKDMSWLTTK